MKLSQKATIKQSIPVLVAEYRKISLGANYTAARSWKPQSNQLCSEKPIEEAYEVSDCGAKNYQYNASISKPGFEKTINRPLKTERGNFKL